MSIPFIPGEPSWLESLLKPAAQSFGSGIQAGIAEAFQQDKFKKNLRQAEEQIGNLDETSSQLEVFKALQRIQDPTLRKEFSDFASKTLLSPKKNQNLIGKLSTQDLTKIPSKDFFLSMDPEERNKFAEQLIDSGLVEDLQEANSYLLSTEGARTDFLKKKGLQKERGEYKYDRPRGLKVSNIEFTNPQLNDQNFIKKNYTKDIFSNINLKGDLPFNWFDGLTDDQKAKQRERFSQLNDKFSDQRYKSLRSNQDKRKTINRMIKNSDKLPSNLFIRASYEKIDNPAVKNWLAGPIGEQWEKDVASFLDGLKDTFGARITNFDIEQYNRRFPRIANSPEGRKMILKQMSLVNAIDRIYDGVLEAVYKEYDFDEIDPQRAKKIAEEKAKPLINDLLNEYKSNENKLIQNSSKSTNPKGILKHTEETIKENINISSNNDKERIFEELSAKFGIS